MSGTSKVLTGLIERRAVEAAFAALADAVTPDDVARQADVIAGYGNAALPVLIARLDTDDPTLRGGLAQVAQRLEREAIVAALRGVSRSHDRSDRARLSALTLLDRYLHEPIEDALLAGIQDPDAVAIRSLNELIAAMEQDEAAILEYLIQLAQQPPEVPGMILAAIPRLSAHPHLVTLLRMFAQGESEPHARAAIEQLGRLRIPETLAALDTLTTTLPPALSSLAKRGGRKLRMSGVRQPASSEAEQDSEWRALLSPVDGGGLQICWFIHRNSARDLGTLLTVITSDMDGIVACFGSRTIPIDRLPPARPIGRSYTLSQGDDAPAIQMLEATFDQARCTVRAAQERHWAAGTLPPLEYRYFNPLLWNAEPRPEAEPLPEPGAYSPEQTAALLDHPLFTGWFWRDEAMFEAARRNGAAVSAAVSGARRSQQISALAAAHFGPELIASYQRRLEAMARWLASAGQAEAAAMAMCAVHHLAGCAPAESPFVRRLIGIGLDVAAVSLQTSQI